MNYTICGSGSQAGPECAACERAKKDYASLEKVTDDLAALVRRLAQSLRKSAPSNDLPTAALDYLRRNGLDGRPLREGEAEVSPLLRSSGN